MAHDSDMKPLDTPRGTMRIVFHCDLDSFFASVEQSARPELAGLPVAVSAARGQSVITAASYEAKRLGVKVGVPLRRARELCPNLQFIPARMEAYQRAGAFVQDLIRSIGAPIETLGLDECFFLLDKVDLNKVPLPANLLLWPIDPYERASIIANWIKSNILTQTGLRITVGIGSNKTVAKLASDMGKPDGLLVIQPEDELGFLHRTALSAINGIGPRSTHKLNQSGYFTVGDISTLSLTALISILGKHQGKTIYAISRNILDESVTPNPQPKSTSATRSFGLSGHIAVEALEELLAEALSRISYTGKSVQRVGIFAADSSGHYQAKHDLRAPTADLREISASARRLTAQIPPTFRANIAGITFDGLSDSEQLRLGLDIDWLSNPDFTAPTTQRDFDPSDNLRRSAFRGMPVSHSDFGSGVVQELGDTTITVLFSDRVRVLEYWTPLQY